LYLPCRRHGLSTVDCLYDFNLLKLITCALAIHFILYLLYRPLSLSTVRISSISRLSITFPSIILIYPLVQALSKCWAFGYLEFYFMYVSILYLTWTHAESIMKKSNIYTDDFCFNGWIYCKDLQTITPSVTVVN